MGGFGLRGGSALALGDESSSSSVCGEAFLAFRLRRFGFGTCCTGFRIVCQNISHEVSCGRVNLPVGILLVTFSGKVCCLTLSLILLTTLLICREYTLG